MKATKFKITLAIAAPPGAVFAALTNAKIIAQWSGQRGKVSSRPGGKFEMFDGWVKGRVLEYKPDKSLVFTWRPDDWEKNAQESIVSCKFSATKTGTKVILEHTNFPNENEMKNHEGGWKEHVFDPLKAHFSK